MNIFLSFSLNSVPVPSSTYLYTLQPMGSPGARAKSPGTSEFLKQYHKGRTAGSVDIVLNWKHHGDVFSPPLYLN